MPARRIAIIGAGSAYLPGLVRGLLGDAAADLAGSELVLHDLDGERLRLMATLAARMLLAAGADVVVRPQPELRPALVDADFVLTTFRPGGMGARHLDESIPLRHGVVGQETAGPGGFLMACRSVPVLLEIARLLGLLPNSYSRYYFFHDDVVVEQRAKGRTRAQEVMARLPALYSDYAAAAASDRPDPSTERGGGGHGELAIDVIRAIAGDQRRRLIVNTRNQDAIEGMQPDAIVEVPSIVGAEGPAPIPMGPIPRPVRGLTMAIHEYEWLAAAAASSGSRRLALQALSVHPFIGSKRVAERILEEGLAAHRAHLPQFFPR